MEVLWLDQVRKIIDLRSIQATVKNIKLISVHIN